MPRMRCCTPEAAWQWVDLLATGALDGDHDSLCLLPAAILPALLVESAQ